MSRLYACSWLFTLLIYLILDGLWLGLIAKSGYSTAMGSLLRENFIVWPWLAFYLLYTLAIAHLVVVPNISSSFRFVLISAIIFGLAAYGAYNLTNYAIIENWPLSITLKDWGWGTFATTLSSFVAWLMTRRILNIS